MSDRSSIGSWDYYFKDECRLCAGRNLERVIELSPTPPGNHFVTQAELDQPQSFYPLEVYFCNDCAHLQLGHVVNPGILYRKNYSYVSATSPIFVAHLRDYSHWIRKTYLPTPGGLVVDIGSNDGTALSFFKETGFRVVGVDPATEVAQSARDHGIETNCEFFSTALAERWRDQYGPAALITSHNACAHIDDLKDVFEGVRRWLADDGLFVIEVGYLLDVYENGWFDTIYHEHLDYHSVSPLVKFYASLGFEVIDVKRINPQGGSIRVIAQRLGGSRKIEDSVSTLVELEKRAGLNRAETFVGLNDRINQVKERLGKLVTAVKSKGKSIAGFGAPTKATTLLTHFELDDVLDFLVDENPLKQGLYSPGAHIPVFPAGAIYERRPDFLMILAWNFAEDIMERHRRYHSEIGKFILPMPEPQIVD